MRIDPFDGLTEFLAVAEHRSFTAAAASLGVSPTAVGQAIRTLETRLGVALFARTTRRVGLTEAGAAFLARLGPAAGEIRAAVEGLAGFRDRPMGRLRLSVPRLAVSLVLAPLLARFRAACPDVTLEIAVEDGTLDITEKGYDAGIRIGESLARDMIAVALTADITWTVVGSPAYFAAHGRPAAPEDLARHVALRYRFPTSGAVYRWEFTRHGRDLSIDVPGAITLDDADLALRLAEAGQGLTYLPLGLVADAVAAGRLERVLTADLPTGPGLYLYFPARAQTQPKLRAFVDVARRFARESGR
ncbi:LysR family transcriptional regulator [Siculibacillus lacustris]|uniref:LysR family transcriptional regulator n=2 Tax=Siculibacillus lacustris TaxID=1549641 RepID=A0A4Q9VY35_9HYPH|nr:LysR family transcriptional regulator [Siculibacillus lacustris]